MPVGAHAVRRLLIVANRPSERTRALAEAALEGARHPDVDGVEARLLDPLEAGPDDVLGADGIILGTTENFGSMAGLVKDFLERIYHPCLESTQGRPWALYVRAGNDGDGARTAIERIVTGLRWRAIGPALVLSGDWDEGFADSARELGTTMAAGLEAGVF